VELNRYHYGSFAYSFDMGKYTFLQLNMAFEGIKPYVKVKMNVAG
jgi:hypothetical protein